MKCRIIASTILFAGTLLAQISVGDVIVPNSSATVEGPSSFSLTTTSAAGRTYQMTVDSGQLSTVVGDSITGVQWRLNNTATAAWPSVDTSFSSFDIYIGAGVDPSAMSNTFASNFTAGSTQVRSGSLTFLAGSFSNGQTGTTPNAFGPAILFDTPWSYTGGDLTVEFRFSQQVGATNQLALDGLAASGGPGNGWGVDFAARWTGNIAGTTGSNGNFVVTNFMTSAIPEPGSAVLILLVGGFCAMQRRRD